MTATEPKGARITCGAPLQEFWDMFDKKEDPRSLELFKFHLCVVVDADLGPLHPRYDLIQDMGSALIPLVFNKKPLPDGDLMFVFPDRWIGPIYARSFVYCLNRHPSIAKAKTRRKILIVTTQPYIVGDCNRENIRIITHDEEDAMRDTVFGEKMPARGRLRKMENA